MANENQHLPYEKHLSCPVCMDLLSDPRALPCMHTFCVKCLHSHITSVCTKGNERGFECPVCRAITRPHIRGLHPYSWADNFPLNFQLKGIIDEIRQNKMAASEKQVISSKDEKKDKAVLKETRLVNRDKYGTVNVTKCLLHPDKALEFMCSDHCVTLCELCVADEHKDCAHVPFKQSTSVAQKIVQVSDRKHSSRAKDTSDQARAQVVPREPVRPQREVGRRGRNPGHRPVTRLCASERASRVRSADFTSYLQNHDLELAADFSRAHSFDKLNQIEEDKQVPDVVKRPPKHASSKENISYGDSSEKSNTIIQTYFSDGLKRSSRIFGSSDVFPDGNLKSIVEGEEEMVVVNVDSDVGKTHVLLTAEYNIRTRHDRKCCSVTGMAIMSDGRVLLADENNSNVKLFTSKGSFVACLNLAAAPWDVTAIEDFEAAVSIPSQKCIQFLLVENSLTQTRSIDLGKPCYGIAYHKSELFVAMDTEIRILKYDGQVIRKIVSESFKKKRFPISMNKPFFRGARYLCYDGSGLAGVIHVSDSEKSSLSSFDNKGGLMSKMRLGESGVPLSVSLGEKGQIFVCQEPNKLVTISIGEHGNRIRPLVTVDNIMSVDYNRSAKQLWVTRRLNNVVKVFTIKS